MPHQGQSRTRPAIIFSTILTLAFVIAACGSVGSAGTLAPRSPDSGTIAPSSPEPSESADPGVSPDPSAEPTDEPTDTPTDAPTDAPTDEPTQPGATPAPTPRTTPRPTTAPSGVTTVKIYLFVDGTLVPVQRTIDGTRAVGRAALTELFEGPTAAEKGSSPGLSTSIPDGTILLGLDIADGLATVDLSREFESGGGSASMFGRLAQVVFTLTQFPTVEGVAFRLDSEPVTVFSGEGIVLDGPSVRTDYESFLPSIFVDRPAYGGTAGNPLRVTGLANVFEASFFVEILDEDGVRLVRQHVMATCGTGCWGTFDVTLPYDVPSRQTGSLVTYVLSARDGSVEEVRTYPVTLVP